MKTTTTLTEILKETGFEKLEDYFEENSDSMISEEKPFSAYMRDLFRKKGITQQEIFLAADISEGYGYKLISEEKKTKQRDVILRLCLAGRFDLQETQCALKLYGMSPLYAKVRRDAVLIIAVNQGIYDIAEVNDQLRTYEMEPLYACRPAE